MKTFGSHHKQLGIWAGMALILAVGLAVASLVVQVGSRADVCAGARQPLPRSEALNRFLANR